MAVPQFVGVVPVFLNNGATATSTSFTPSAGETLIVKGELFDGTVTINFTDSQSNTYVIPNPPGQDSPAPLTDDAQSIGYLLSAPGGSMTCSVGGTGGTFSQGVVVRFSGVSSIIGQPFVETNAPGTGLGAIHGYLTAVPTNSVLVAICVDHSSGGTVTITPANSGTLLYQNTAGNTQSPMCIQRYGPGSTVLPMFTTNVGADAYTVFQLLLSSSDPLTGGNPPQSTATTRLSRTNGGTNWGLDIREWF